MSHHRLTWFLHQPRCSGLCLFVTVYLSLFVIAGVLLFGSLSQIRNNNAPSGSKKRAYVSDEDGERSASYGARYYNSRSRDDDYDWKNLLYSNRSQYHYEKYHEEGAEEVDIHDKLTATWTGQGLRWPYSNPALINCSSLQDVTDLDFVASGWTKAVYKGRYQGRDVAVKTVNLNGHDILKCQEKHKPMSPAASLPLCYRRAAAKILREIILLTELAHDNIVKVYKQYFILTILTYQRIDTQRFDKHPAIQARNNRTNSYSSLLGNTQRANGLARWLSRDLFSVRGPCREDVREYGNGN